VKLQCWHMAIAIGLGISEAVYPWLQNRAVAQSVIVPDTTLGAENSQVLQNATLNGQPITTPINGVRRPIEAIIGGARRGSNVFHSFSEFNVNADRGAFFVSPDNQVQNILARVTGRNSSVILGKLGTFQVVNGEITTANANLFLINPNGILFGSNASLDVGGSFVATTANVVQFGDRGFFSATAPESPSLLTVDPSAFLFNQIGTQPIVNQSRVANPNVPSFVDGLRVNDGLSLILLGGNVVLDGGVTQARGGRVELGGLAGSGSIGLTTNGNALHLNFPSSATLANITLTNGANLDTSGFANSANQAGGDIQTHSTNLTLANNSTISSNTFGSQNGGDILLRASQVELSDRSAVNAFTDGAGNGGNIEIDADQLRMQNSAQIGTGTNGGTGSGGRIVVRVNQSIDLLNASQFGSLSVGRGDQTDVGKSGDIVVTTGTLNIQNGSGMLASTFVGGGNAGNIGIQATAINLSSSNLVTSSFGIGTGGNIEITTGTLSVNQGSSIITSTLDPNAFNFNTLDPKIYSPDFVNLVNTLRASAPPGQLGQANAGKLSITATDSVEVVGTSTDGSSRSNLSTGTFGSGRGGDLTITTGNLQIAEGGSVSSSSSGSGRGGNITISATNAIDVTGISSSRAFISALGSEASNTGRAGDVMVSGRSLTMQNGGLISTSTFGEGQGGDLTVTAREAVTLNEIGTRADGQIFRSGLSSSTSGTGAAGNVRILDTGRVTIRGGAIINTSTSSIGRGGNVEVNADTIDLVGFSSDRQFVSVIGSESLNSGAGGKAGDVIVRSRLLNARDGALISTQTFGEGQGGNLTIAASEATTLIGTGTRTDGQISQSGLVSSTSGSGNAGTLQLSTRSLRIQDGASISASTFGSGIGGDINIVIDGTLRMNTGFISSASASSEGGDINITARNIRLQGNSNIITSVFSGAGGGGNITLTAKSIIALNDSDILAFARAGNGGNITFKTPAFFGQNYRPAPAGTDPLTLDKNNRVDVNASGNVSGIITIPDTTFIQNSLTQLAQNLIDPNTLLANSCIVRNRQQNGRFLVTGSGGFPVRPGDQPPSTFPTGEVRSLPQTQTNQTWQPGDPIAEPQGIYRLANGRLVMSRECEP